jgi:HK97 family phage major capsid protein
MKTIKQLKTERDALKAKGLALIEAAQAGERDLTEAEETQLSAIETDLETLHGQIAAMEAREERRMRLAGTGAVTASPGAASVPTATRVQVGADRATLDPRAGFANVAEFARAVRAANPQVPGMHTDERLGRLYATPTGFHRESGANEGYLVPPEFRDRIWELVFEADNLLAQVDTEPTSANQVNDLSDDWQPWGSSGIRAFWRGEGSQMTPTRADVKPRAVYLNELYAFVTATDELLEDAPRLSNRLEMKAAQAINWKIDDAIVYGDGVAKPLGWMSSGALVTVAKESGQAADTIVAANVTKMFSRLLPSSVPRAAWRVNTDVLPQLMTMTLGDQPIWTPPGSGLVNAPGGFLLGRPIVFTEHAKTLGDLGDIQLVDPKGYYALRKEGGIKFASSIHLYFDYGLQAFRWTIRLGGQPHLAAPVSPKHGTATKSHFVTLAERA